MLQYQMFCIIRDKGVLVYDDRLDVLVMVCVYWVEQMVVDVDREMRDRREELMDKEFNKFINGVNIMIFVDNFFNWLN